MKEFKSDKMQIIKLSIIKIIITGIIGIVGYSIILILLNKDFNDYDFNGMAFVSLTVMVGLFYTLMFSVVSIVVDQDKLQIRRRGKVLKTFSLNDYRFGSLIDKQIYMLIPLTSKYLSIVNIQNLKKYNYNCKLFSKSTFEQLITYMTNPNLYGKKVENIQKENIDNMKLKQYKFPKEKLLDINYKKTMRNCILVLVMPIIIIILSFATNKNEAAIGALVNFSTILILPFIGISIYWIFKYCELSKNTPNNISIDSNAITVDNMIFDVKVVNLISLTPPKYINMSFNAMRKMIIKYNNKTYTYLLGYSYKNNEYFSEYTELYNNIEHIFSCDNSKFAKSL